MAKNIKPFSAIRNQRVSQLVENNIKNAIFKNHFEEGDKIPSERELAEMFGVSRLSVREALRSLERSGILVIKKGATGGAYVRKSDTTPVVESLKDMIQLGHINLEDVAQARMIIEPGICSMAAKKATAKDIEKLIESNELLKKDFETGNPGVENNPRIHILISEIAGNQVLSIITRSLMAVHAFSMRNIQLNNKAKKQIIVDHDKIIDALKKGDEKEAAQWAQKHIINVQDNLIDLKKKEIKDLLTESFEKNND